MPNTKEAKNKCTSPFQNLLLPCMVPSIVMIIITLSMAQIRNLSIILGSPFSFIPLSSNTYSIVQFNVLLFNS